MLCPDENNATASKFSFFSSFQSNLLREGLHNQIGWGHVWNRFSGPLSCHGQPKQCALTPLLPPAWWDGNLQSPIPRDIRRLEQYGVKLSSFGIVDEKVLNSFCKSRKTSVKTIQVTQQWSWLSYSYYLSWDKLFHSFSIFPATTVRTIQKLEPLRSPSIEAGGVVLK